MNLFNKAPEPAIIIEQELNKYNVVTNPVAFPRKPGETRLHSSEYEFKLCLIDIFITAFPNSM